MEVLRQMHHWIGKLITMHKGLHYRGGMSYV